MLLLPHFCAFLIPNLYSKCSCTFRWILPISIQIDLGVTPHWHDQTDGTLITARKQRHGKKQLDLKCQSQRKLCYMSGNPHRSSILVTHTCLYWGNPYPAGRSRVFCRGWKRQSDTGLWQGSETPTARPVRQRQMRLCGTERTMLCRHRLLHCSSLDLSIYIDRTGWIWRKHNICVDFFLSCRENHIWELVLSLELNTDISVNYLKRKSPDLCVFFFWRKHVLSFFFFKSNCLFSIQTPWELTSHFVIYHMCTMRWRQRIFKNFFNPRWKTHFGWINIQCKLVTVSMNKVR